MLRALPLVLPLVPALFLLLFAQAEAPKPTPFDPPRPGTPGSPGVRARFAESLQRMGARLDRNPGDIAALERLYELNELLGRNRLLVAPARSALEVTGLDEKARARARGILGLALVAEVNATGARFGNFIMIVNGRVIQRGRDLTNEQKKLFTEAEGHLRAAVKHDNRRAALRDALAEVIDALRVDPDKSSEEANKLREQADALRMRTANSTVGPDPYQRRADELATEAATLEQRETDPDHVRALEKRKHALVLAFCADTVTFDFAATLYEPVCLLASRDLLDTYLTRTFLTRKGGIGDVPPKIHGAPFPKRRELLEALGRDQTSGADAALLALLRGAPSLRDPIAGEAAKALANGEHLAARAGLPLLLAKAVFSGDTTRFPLPGQRLLIELAVGLDCNETSAVLAAMLERDRDLSWPRGIAWALGKLGTREQAPKLAAVARNERRDIWFRREAARACARLDPEAAKALDAFPELAIALAAARYEAAPDETTKGRLLNGLSNEAELDEAARYCAELKITEAMPALERFLREFGEKKDHPARDVVTRAHRDLSQAR